MAGGDRAFRHGVAEQPVGRFADRDDGRLYAARLRPLDPPAAKLGGAKTAGRLGKTGDLGRVVETIEGLLRIVAQHDRVRRVERENASGEAMWGPGYCHD